MTAGRHDIQLSAELREMIDEAEDLAHLSEQAPSSVHLLLAFFTSQNGAADFLAGRGISADSLLPHVRPTDVEPKRVVRAIMERAVRIAVGSGESEVRALHVLIGLSRVRDCTAYVVLERAGVPPDLLRTRAMTLLTGSGQSWRGPGARPRHHLTRPPGPVPSRPRAGEWSPPLLAPPVPKPRHTPPAARPKPPAPLVPIEPAPPVSFAPAPPSTVELAPVEPNPLPPAPDDPGAAWALPVSDFPWLSSMGRNLSVEAARGELDLLVGREREVVQLADILGKRRSNNPCLVGEAGVGKTAIVEGLATRWIAGTDEEQARIVVAVDVGRLLMGTHLRGSFNEKLESLREEVERAEGKVVVFFDELHTLVGAGATGENALDAANELKAVLARGRFPCIGATTPDEFERHVAKDAALTRRFVAVRVDEPTPEQAETMLYRLLPAYADHHGVGYAPSAIQAAVRLSVRFLPDRQLPDKAIGLLDLAGSHAARAGQPEVTEQEIGALVAEQVGLPVERILESDRDKLLALERRLAEKVIGHEAVLERIADVVRRNAAGFARARPRGSFLLVGPTGVGKTETAKALAEIMHGSADRLVRFDLSEYAEAHAVSRLVGAPPGYVGHDAGGQLTDAARRHPGAVLLFDEVEKAHREVLQVLLQVLDEARLTDSHGRTVSFRESIILLTSNLGAEDAHPRRTVGFGAEDGASGAQAVLAAARRGLSPELWGRVDEKLYFAPLDDAELTRIARQQVTRSSERLLRERGISYELDGHALAALVEQARGEAHSGARPLRRWLGQLVESPIAARILEGRLHAGEHILVSRADQGGGLVFRVGAEATTASQRPSRHS